MASEWTETPLSEVVKLQRGHDLPERLRRPGPIRVVSSGDSEGWHDTAIAEGPGVVLGRATNIGRPRWVAGPYWPHNTTLYVTDFKGNDPRWVFHLFETLDLGGYNSGSVQAMLNRNYIAGVPVRLPDADEQTRIAGVIGRIDELIDTNLKVTEALGATTKAVALRFMESVSDRPTATLFDFCTVTKGYSYRSAELVSGGDTFVNLKNIGRGGTFEERGFKPITPVRAKPSQVLSPGDIVVSMTDLTQDREVIARPVRIPDVAVPGRMIASLDLAVVRPTNGHSREFLAAALDSEDFHSFALGYCNGTTVLHLSPRVFEDYRLPLVRPHEQTEFAETISAFNAQADALSNEIADLMSTREALLPLLMSGRVRVRKGA